MPKITKHLPNFMEGFDQPTQEFSTLEELENISFVKTWQNWQNFDQFRATSLDSEQPLLSAHFVNGEHWVVGLLTPDAKDILKVLNAKDYNVERLSGSRGEARNATHEAPEERALASS